MKKYIPFIVLACIWIFAGLPLLMPGFIPTHDGEYHLIRFNEFATMLQAGYVFPRWAPDLNSGYGIPLFNFFYPLPNYIGALFHFVGLSLSDSFKLVLFTGYITAAVVCYLWLKKLFDATAAMIGTIVFSFVPYWFVDIYVRGSVGEVLALASVMIVLAAVEYDKKIVVSFGMAGLILSHNILAMLFVPVLLIYVLVRNKKLITHYFVGFLLSLYFWVPALLERQYVVGLNTVNFRDHFPDVFQLLVPSWGTNFSQPGSPFDEMSQQVGIVPLFVFALATYTVIRARGEGGRMVRHVMVGVLGTVAICIVLMLPISKKIWELVTPLQFLQYPWRLLSFIIPASGYAAAYFLYRLKNRGLAMGIAVFAVISCLQYIRPNVYAPRNDEYYLTRREFTDGTSSLGNGFSTVWVGWMAKRAEKKIEIIGKEGPEGEDSITIDEIKPTDYRFQIIASNTAIMRVHALYYPGWKAVVDGKNTQVEYKNGIIQFSVSSGRHAVRVYFGETMLRSIVDALSILSLFWLVWQAILEGIYAHRH